MRHRKTAPRPFEIGAGVILIAAGVGTALAPAAGVAFSLAFLGILGAFLGILGGLMILGGLYYTKHDVVLGFGIERAGHCLGAGAWISNAAFTMHTADASSAIPPVVMAVASLWRARHLRQESKTLWKTAKEMRRKDGR